MGESEKTGGAVGQAAAAWAKAPMHIKAMAKAQGLDVGLLIAASQELERRVIAIEERNAEKDAKAEKMKAFFLEKAKAILSESDLAKIEEAMQ